MKLRIFYKITLLIVFFSGLLLVANNSVFSLGEGVIIQKGGEKVSDEILEDLTPEERQKQRYRAYEEESMSYDARESARDPNKYWREKEEREQELLDDATTDHEESDKKTHKWFKNFLKGPEGVRKN